MELELEIAILDGWARFWYRGELLSLPADLVQQAREQRERADKEKERADREAKDKAEVENRVRNLEEQLRRLQSTPTPKPSNGPPRRVKRKKKARR